MGTTIQYLTLDTTAENPTKISVLPAKTFTIGTTVNAWAPKVTASVLSVSGSVITLGALSGTGEILPGDFIGGITGGAFVTSVSNTQVTISGGTAPIPGTILGFHTGTTTAPARVEVCAWANYIHLDEAERKFFATSQHDILISQVQQAVMNSLNTQDFAFAHPVKFIAWPCLNYSTTYANGSGKLARECVIRTIINGVESGEKRHLPAFTDVARYYGCPWGEPSSDVGIISFALDTSSLQPTGTLNFSRLDTYRIMTGMGVPNGLKGLATPDSITPCFYAVNYNVLRIKNGMGAVLYV
jgi:hypothetical protein